MKAVSELIGLVTMGIIIMGALILLFTLPTMWLWNWLMPYIFGLPTLDFLQTMGLLILSSLLFRESGTGNKSK